MTTERIIQVEPGSEIDRIFDGIEEGPIILDRRGTRFQVQREPSIPPGLTDDGDASIRSFLNSPGVHPPQVTDPVEAQRIWDEVVGSWADLDTDQMIADIRRWREEGSRPWDQP